MRKRRILSILTALALCLSLLPATALADGSTTCPGGDSCNHEAAVTVNDTTTHYDTIGEALKAAGGQGGTGGTVMLLKDSFLQSEDSATTGTVDTYSTFIYKDIVLDLNGKTLKCNADYAGISVRPGVRFTIQNGVFENISTNQWACAIEASKSANVGGNGCTITLTGNVTVKAKYSAVYGVGYTTIEVLNSAAEGEYAIYGAGPTNKVTLRDATVTGSKFGVYQGPYDPNVFLNTNVAGSVYEIYSSTIKGGDDYAGVCINNYITNVATGNHTLLVEDSQIIGGSGIETKRTNVTIKGEDTVITATGTTEEMYPGYSPVSSGYAVAAAYYQSEAGAMGTLKIEGGTFDGAIGIQKPIETGTMPTSPATLTISGGTFDTTVKEEYLADNMMQDEDGKIIEIVPAESITLDSTGVEMYPDDTKQLNANVTPSNTTDTIIWESSDSDVATVDNGNVTAVDVGTATITVSSQENPDVKATCTVTVTNAPVPAENISLNQTELDLYVGNHATLTATVEPGNATNKNVTWSSNNPEVATVTNGEVTAVGEGEATITASTNNGKTAICTVTVTNAPVPVESIALDQGTLSLCWDWTNRTAQLTATVLPANATDKAVTWQSSNTAVATVDQNGLVKAVGPGTAIITATAGGKTATCVVTVTTYFVPTQPGAGSSSYNVSVASATNGMVAVSPTAAPAGTLVTVTTTPDAGYQLASLTVTAVSGVQQTLTPLGNGKFTFTMPASSVTVAAVFQAEAAAAPTEPTAPDGWVNPFTDVTTNAWYYDAVGYASANGLMGGTSATTFAPESPMNRAMVWTVIARLAGQTITGANWVEDTRTWAMAQGVSDGTNPDANVTREELVTMLYRYAGSPEMNVPELGLINGYPDSADISDWAQNAFAWALSTGIIDGRDGKLAAGDSVTRAEAATILARFHMLSK